MMFTLLRSLLLTTLLSFIAPVLLVGTLLTALFFTSHLPGVSPVSQIVSGQILEFLTIFGSGYPVQGIVTIGVTFALVGSLFDLFNFYVYQGTRGQ